MRRKILSVLLVLCMVLTLLPASVLAAEPDGEQENENQIAATEAANEDNEETTAADTDAADGSEAEGEDAEADMENGLPKATSGQINLTPGQTYTLTGDISNVSFLGIWGSDVADTETTLDLDGHTITATTGNHGAIYLAAGNLKIVNSGSSEGKLIGNGFNTIIIAGTAAKKLTIGGNVTVETVADNYGISIEGSSDKTSNAATIVLDGCKITGQGSGIAVNGYIFGETAPKITLQNGASIDVSSHGIYQAGNADVTVGSATIKGVTGVEVRAGKLTVNNGAAITATGTYKTEYNGNGSTVDGAAIAVSQHVTNQAVDVTVNGGTFTATGTNGTALSIVRPSETATAAATEKNVKVEINGGTFEKCVENMDYAGSELAIKGGTIKVADAWSLAAMYYTATGGAGTTFELAENIQLYAPINVMGVATLNLNGKNVTVKSGSTIVSDEGDSAMFQVAGADAKLTITGSGAITANTSDSFVVTVGSKQDTSGECIFEGDATYTGSVTVAHVFMGKITVENGTFKLNTQDSKKQYDFMLNIQDTNAQDKSGQIVVTGGTFHGFNPAANAADTADQTTCYVDTENYEVEETTRDDITVYTVKEKTTTPPADVSLTFAEITDADLKLYEKSVSDLGTFKVSTSTEIPTKITVTGSAQYIDNWEQFSSIKGDQSGHYLPISITANSVSDESTTVVITGRGEPNNVNITSGDVTDGKAEIQLVMKLDNLTKKEFTVKVGETTYTVDVSGIILLPEKKTDGGVTVETKIDAEGETAQVVTEAKKSDGSLIASVSLPQSDLSGGKLEIVVKPAEAPETITAGEKVKAAIQSATIVEVTVKIDGEVQFAGTDDALANADIAITIKGLTGGKTYHVFSINKDGGVTSYGYKELGAEENSITVNSKHLTYIAAAEMSKTNLTHDDVENDSEISRGDQDTSGLTKTSGDKPNKPDDPTDMVKVIYQAIEREKTFASLKVTGLSNDKQYVMQISKVGCTNATDYTIIELAPEDGAASVYVLNNAGGYNVTLYEFKGGKLGNAVSGYGTPVVVEPNS